jgi:pimeloyl-ACP methyl ester carboxylesterase
VPDVETEHVRIHFEDIGSGEPVLLLHGGMASWKYWQRAGYVDALAEYRLLIPDFRGHGESSRPHDESSYGLGHDVADVVAVLDAAGVRSTGVCGWSWGGTVGLALAALHPDRVTAVLTTGTSGRHGFSDVPTDFDRFPEMCQRIETGGMPAMGASLRQLGGGVPWLYDLMLDNDPVALAAWYRAQPIAPPPGCALADVVAPTLLLAGEEEAQILAIPSEARPPNSRCRVLPGRNHVTAFLSPDILVPALDALLVGRGTA